MPKKLLQRNELPKEETWDLEKMYPSTEAWEKEFQETNEALPTLDGYPNTITQSGERLFQYLKATEALGRKLEKLYVYAKMKLDEDNRKNKYQGMQDKAMMLSIRYGELTSFFGPEIMEAGEEKIKALIAEYPKLKEYNIAFEEILRYKPHTLSQKEEALLAMTGEMADSPHMAFTMLNEADMTFPEITLEDGDTIQITHGNYIRLMESPHRSVREQAFKGLYTTYSNFRNTFGATLSGSIKKDVFYAKAQNYSSALEAALFGDNVSTALYDNLIDTVKEHLPLFQDYLSLRKSSLNLDELHFYDLYTPLFAEAEKEIPFDEGYEIIKKALLPLGEDYQKRLEQAREERWIDMRENEGKRSGAYSWGVYDSVPYLFLSYQNNLNSVFTLCHELGHSIHSYYSRKEQPYQYADYRIFVAEVASILNETLLTEYLLNNSKDEKEKHYILNQYLEEFRGTVYRQTMFAEFEKITHAKTEAMESLTADDFSDIYFNLNKEYFGDVMTYDEEIAMEWSRIPHFYSGFYVYKYATSFAAAQYLAAEILKGNQDAVDAYLTFLQSGCSDQPNELLKKAGVDLTDPKTIKGIFSQFEKYLAMLKKN